MAVTARASVGGWRSRAAAGADRLGGLGGAALAGDQPGEQAALDGGAADPAGEQAGQ
jgi:hypothetical protein